MPEDDDKLHCRDCQYYRPQWGECCFGGGWGHYPEPDDECVRMFYDDEDEEATERSSAAEK